MENANIIEQIEKYFAKLAKIDFVPFDQKSLTAISGSLTAQSIQERDVVELMYLIELKSASFKSEALDLLGINLTKERLRVCSILNNADLSKIKSLVKDSPELVIRQINDHLKQKGLRTYLLPQKAETLEKAIRMIQYSFNATYNTKLIMAKGLVVDVVPYAGRYKTARRAEVQRLVNVFSELRARFMLQTTDEEKLFEESVEVLKSVGHPSIALEQKTLSAIADILLRHSFALKAILRFRTESENSEIPDTKLFDLIALEIVAESETVV